MRFVKSSIWSGISVAAKALVSLLVGKLFALMGTGGVTFLAHFQNLVAIFTTLPNGGVNTGLIKYMANPNLSRATYRKYFSAGLGLNIGFFLLTVLGLVVFGSGHLNIFLSEGDALTSSTWIICLFLGLLALIVNLFFMSVLLAKGYLPHYVAINVLSSFLTGLFVYLVHDTYTIQVALLAFLAGQSVVVVLSFVLVSIKGLLAGISWKPDKQVLSDIGKFLIMSVSTVIFAKAVNYVVRLEMIRDFPLQDVEDWQSVAFLSSRYIMVFTSVMAMIYYPKIAALLHVPKDLKRYVKQIFFGMNLVVIIGLCVVWYFRGFWLSLFLSESHVQAAGLFDYQLIGDFFHMSSYILATLIYVQAKVKLYVAMHAASAVLYVVFITFLLEPFGIEGVIMAYALKEVLYFIFNMLYFRRLLFT